MANWLDLSNNANCFKSIYEQGFVDLSGGSIQTRNDDQKLIIAGDASLNNAYLGEYRTVTKIVTTTNVSAVNITGTVANMISQHSVNETADYRDFLAISGDGKTYAIWHVNGSKRLYVYKDLGDGNGYTKIVDDFSFFSQNAAQVKLNYDGTKLLLAARYDLQSYGGNNDGGLAIVLEYDPTKTTTSNSYLYSPGNLPADYGPVGWKVMGNHITGPNNGHLADITYNEHVSLSDDGLTFAFGVYESYENAYVYTWNGSAWVLKGSIIAEPSNVQDFGRYLSMSGDGNSIIVGSANDKHWVFKWSGTEWEQQGGYIYVEGAGDQRGQAINTDGTVIAVADQGSSGENGIIKIFDRNPSETATNHAGWTQRGNTITNMSTNVYIGRRLCITSDGNMIATPLYNNSSQQNIYKYNSSNNTWGNIPYDSNVNNGTIRHVALSKFGTHIALIDGYNSKVQVHEIEGETVYEQVPEIVQFGHMSVGCDTATASANNYKLDVSGTMDICGNLFSSGDISLNDYFTDEIGDTEEILEIRLANATFAQQTTFAGDFYEQDGHFCVNKTGDRYAWKSAYDTSVYIFDICGNIMTTIDDAADNRYVHVFNALPDFSMFAVPYGDDKKLKIFVKKADFVEGVSEGYESGGDLTLNAGDDRVGRSCCRLRRHPITNDIYLCTHDGYNDIQVHKYNPNDKTWSQIGSAIPGYDNDRNTGNWGSYSEMWYGHTDFAIKPDGTLVICHAQPSYTYKIDIRTYDDASSEWTTAHDTYYRNNNEVRGVYLTENASKLFICHYRWMCRENIILSDNTFKTTGSYLYPVYGTDIFGMWNPSGTINNYNSGIRINETGNTIVTSTSTSASYAGYYYLDINDNWQHINITYPVSNFSGYFGKMVGVSYYGDYVAVCQSYSTPFGQLVFFSMSGDKTNIYKQGNLKAGKGNIFIGNDCSVNGILSHGGLTVDNVNISFPEDTNITQNQLIVNKNNNSLNQMNGFKLHPVDPYEWNSVVAFGNISTPINIRCSDDGSTIAYTWNGSATSTQRKVSVYNYDNVAKTWTQKGSDKFGTNVNNVSLSSSNKGFGYGTGSLGMDRENLNRIISGGIARTSISANGNNRRGFVNIIEFDSTNDDWNTVYYQEGNTNQQYLGGHKNGMSGNGNYAFASSFNDYSGSDTGANPTYVYERDASGNWTIQATFTKSTYSDLGNAFSADVDMNYAGDMMVFCDDYETGNNAWIYKNISGTWTKMGNSIDTDILKPSSCCINKEGNIVGFGSDYFGGSGLLNDGIEIYEYSKALTETDGTWTRIFKSVADIVNGSNTFSTRVRDRGLTMNGAGDMILAMSEYAPTTGSTIYRKVNDAWSRTNYFLQNEITYSAAITADNNFYMVSVNDPKVEYFELNTSSQVNEMVVPGNITIIDSSANNYGAYTVYTTKDASTHFSVGKSASNVFNIVNQNNAGVYMVSGNNSLTSTSDIRLKKEIEPLEDATERIMKLNPCTYKWKTQTDEKRRVGFIAQEVEEVFPELVRETTYPGGSTYKGVATEDFVGYLIKVMENQDRRLKLLEETK